MRTLLPSPARPRQREMLVLLLSLLARADEVIEQAELLRCMSLLMADSVAKVFLRHGSQILRGVGAAIEQRCGGPRRHKPNSQAILAAGLRLYRAAIVACFVLWREFSSCGFWDFCNTIGT
jgi:hypothetical protein